VTTSVRQKCLEGHAEKFLAGSIIEDPVK
jgi:hypothetical protein